MMKTLCVVVVVLSLTSVCQSASLACERLLKPVDKGPDLPGRWYLVAMSSNACLPAAIFNTVFWPSIAADFTSKGTPNIYDGNIKIKMYGRCDNKTVSLFYGNNTILEVDSNNTSSSEPGLLLLQSSCPDCLVIKEDAYISTFLLLSRRKTVTSAELKEFATQADCLGWYKPEVFNSDHEYENCTARLGNNIDEDTSELSGTMFERLKNIYTVSFNCLSEKFLYYPNVALGWAQQKWASLW
ncbi:uncharacterized protein LOC108873551 [Lates japonicus]